ncbi:Glycerophosphoryl diester phosphodiesterase family protein [Penicillium digitatum PHI26]|uniref:Glycerophosphoryl diester phosphodiesterase family protein n=2 Tax=Penicillium digitatum TaxID=36651 RepID=K9GKB5_PEND2|nr:Glycerophosphoryl diester phosphodiesterase family protein [Penicillium digitatum Pd1]EKV05463.1 Glycerophosphoryl diester phosphodiesterase family protein [Penicillium digitatum Pd1]EKV13666.1 Glycerophosphoryl diester phosphodiesterase family protein [Penicillium digitatum PHI26]
MDDTSPISPEEHFQEIPAHFHHSAVAHASPRLPQAIAHRGFKGQYPENTLLSIDGAIRAGAQALELDLHISRDGIVVLSHLTNEPFDIMQRIAKTIESVPKPTDAPDWHRRIVLGCWSARYLPARAKHLPRYAVTLICVDLSYARQFLQVPLISFNVNQMILMGPLGRGFLDEARAARRQVYVWTVNAPNLMRWCIRHGIDGVISDEPGRFRQVCEGWEKEHTGVLGAPNPELDRIPLRQRIQIIAVALYVICFGWILKRMYLTPVERLEFEKHKSK